MYVRRTHRTYKGRTYTNYLLVESAQTAKGPRQKVICSLGDLSPRPREQWLELARKVEAALSGQQQLLAGHGAEVERVVERVRESRARRRGGVGELIRVDPDQITTEEHREAGAVHVGVQFWRKLGVGEILAAAGLGPRAVLLTLVMTMNRLIDPGSEHAMPDWIRRTALADILGTDFSRLQEKALYLNLDRLHPQRVAIEKALAERERTLFNAASTVFFYDLTSTYFEGAQALNPKAQRGYSRDHRPDCKQVVVGLVINQDGLPLAHEIFAGNQQDRSSLGPMLERLQERVPFTPGQTVVVDRGMAYTEDLAAIRKHQLHYVVASRLAEREQFVEEFETDEGFAEVMRQPSPLNPAQKKPKVEVKRLRRGDETVVLCRSAGRVEKDKAIRTTQEKRLVADLERLARRIEKGRLVKECAIGEAIGRLKERYPRVARYYGMTYDATRKRLAVERNAAKYEQAEKLDGAYLLKTDRDDLGAEELWRLYMFLTRAEDAFRDMKSPLSERPIFHHLEHRVETHIFLCVLAYHLLVAIEKTLLDRGVYTSWATVRDTLRTHQVSTVVLPTDRGMVLCLRRGSTPESDHKKLYELLGVPLEVMRPQKTWLRPPVAESDSD